MNLSDDAIPALVKAYQTPSLPAPVREKVGAALACLNYNRSMTDHSTAWQSFHLSTLNADRAIASISKKLDGYVIGHDDSSMMVTTPSGEEFSCSTNYYD